MNTDPNSAQRETESSQKKIETLQSELAAEKERYLHLATDFGTFRKRTTRELERRAAAQKDAFIRELLPVIDNLERALSAEATSSVEQLHRGVQITLQQLYQLLRRHRIEPEESLGRPFDPQIHEAVMTRHDRSRPDQIILEVIERGYVRGGELFRPAKVVVNDLSTRI
jgi:molecular chaperone GrpE